MSAFAEGGYSVTHETSVNSKMDALRAPFIPELCRVVNIPCIDLPQLMWWEKWSFKWKPLASLDRPQQYFADLRRRPGSRQTASQSISGSATFSSISPPKIWPSPLHRLYRRGRLWGALGAVGAQVRYAAVATGRFTTILQWQRKKDCYFEPLSILARGLSLIALALSLVALSLIALSLVALSLVALSLVALSLVALSLVALSLVALSLVALSPGCLDLGQKRCLDCRDFLGFHEQPPAAVG